MELVKLEFAITLEVWFSKTPTVKCKSFLLIANGAENVCFTVSLLATYVYDFQIKHFDGCTLPLTFSYKMLHIKK